MILQVIGKSKFPVLNDIIMAQKIITLKIIRSKYIVAGILQVYQLRKLFVELLLKKTYRRLIR
jgi:hypothetical protein